MKRNLLVSFCALLLAIPLLCAASCSTEPALLQLIGAESESPVFIGAKALSKTELEFRFSKYVQLNKCYFSNNLEMAARENGQKLGITLKQGLDGGERFTADLLVEDDVGNTLNVLVPLTARNDDMPELLISEVRSAYKGIQNKGKSNESPAKSEFIELLAKTDGNLGAIRLDIEDEKRAGPLFEFPPCKVKAGDYIVLYLRTLADDSYNEAAPNAHIFKLPEAKKRIKNDNALITLLNQDDQIIDSLEFESKDCSENRTINRKADGSWYVSHHSGAKKGVAGFTPGKANNTKEYVPKVK
ncbi:MAG: hypothetical protein LBM77_11565 [Spirochaetaceae bacterium]|jgi:hypothetical protein|nr:hypothetical protein [Spirochaetaceae bacterium]